MKKLVYSFIFTAYVFTLNTFASLATIDSVKADLGETSSTLEIIKPTREFKYGDTFILRLGSSPGTEKYIPYFNPKPDNSHEEWKSGEYQSMIEITMPLRNVVHCHIVEVQPVAYEWGTMRFAGYINDDLTNLVADFNSKRFKPAVAQLMPRIENASGNFDFIMTDEKTTKFVMHREGLYNILSLLKIGGKAIFTDLDEDYYRQYDQDAMFLKKTIALFNSGKAKPELNDSISDTPDLDQRRYGLLDLIFMGHEGETIDFMGLHVIGKFCKNPRDIRKNIATQIQTETIETQKLNLITLYLIPLGNPIFKRFFEFYGSFSSSRSIVIERVD